MKTYEALFNPKENKGVFAISLVESPAMEGEFIALNKDTEIQFKALDTEQRILVGLVLEPNKPIYRNQNGEEFNIVFPDNTVKELCYHFMESQSNNNSSIEHTGEKINDVSFVEVWLVRDEKMDTAVALGLKPKIGSWMTAMKVNNDDIWSEYVKTGKVKGFSIDAMLSLSEVQLTKNEITMAEQKTIAEAISDGFNSFLATFKGAEKEIKLGSVKSADGSVTIEYDGDTMQTGGNVFVVAEDGTQVPLPTGEYPLEDGTILVVSEDGKIGEVKPAEAPADPNAPAPMSEAVNEATAIETAIKSIMIKYANEFETKLKVVSDENVALKAQILALASQPAAKPIKSTPTQTNGKFSTLLNKLNN